MPTTDPVPDRRARSLSRRARFALIVLPALVATIAAGVTARLTRDPSPSSEPVVLDELGLRSGLAPAIDLPDLAPARPRVSLAALQGTPVVVNFFASTCVPCRTELPMLEAASQRAGTPVRFVGIDTMDHAAAARKMVADTGVTFPVGFDPAGDTAVRYEVPALPATFFVDAEGTIVGRVLGALTASRLDTELVALTGRGAAPPS